MEMLFLLAYWQGLAKLRLHAENTLTILDDITRSLGIALRAFKKDTCAAFETKELPAEAAARRRKEAASARKKRSVVNTTAAESSTNREGKGKEVVRVSSLVTGKGLLSPNA